MKPFKLNFIFQLFLKIFNLGVCFLEVFLSYLNLRRPLLYSSSSLR